MTPTAPAPLVLVGAGRGVSLIPQPTPLTRLNYFDGKFLRADDLAREQAYLRGLVHLSNRAGGWGVVHGMDVTRGAGATLELAAGLAIDPEGRPLLLPHAATLDVAELLERSRETGDAPAPSNGNGRGGGAFDPCELAAADAPEATPTFGADLHLLVVCHAEALCGEEDVYGRLCEDACATDTDRPYRVEGLAARLLPLSPGAATCGGDGLEAKHLRSLVASAMFADERRLHGRGMSADRLRLDLWCRGARPQPGSCVPLAVVATRGGALEWVDAWAARRERMDAPAQRWWQWRTGMRPLDVFWAQVLQFQCHLRDVLGGGDPAAPGADRCADSYGTLKSTERLLAMLAQGGGSGGAVEEGPILGRELLMRVSDLRSEVLSTLAGIEAGARGRILIEGGIVELPSAGWLPVVPGSVDVGTQVRRLVGEGVDLRICAVPADVIPHAWEEAQHMERICLLAGLDDPARRPPVDVLVPEGRVVGGRARRTDLYEADVSLDLSIVADALTPQTGTTSAAKKVSPEARLRILAMEARGAGDAQAGTRLVESRAVSTSLTGLRGAARAAPREEGGGTLHLAAVGAFGSGAGEARKTPPEQQIPLDLSGAAIDRETEETVEARLKRMRAETSAKAGSSGAGTPLDELAEGLIAFAMRAGAAPAGTSGQTAATAAAVVNEPRPLGLWIAAECEGDPFALPVGGSVRGRATVALGTTLGRVSAGLETVIDAVLTRLDGSAGGDAMRASVRLDARRGLTIAGATHSDRTSATFVASLRRSRGGGGGKTVEMEVGSGGVRLVGRVSAVGTPTLVRFRLGYAVGGGSLKEALSLVVPQDGEMLATVARGGLREDPGVRRTDHPAHVHATRGLDVVAAGLPDDDLRARGSAALFPPEAPEWTGKRVLATRDWVLFHRRRPSSCDCCTPLPEVEAGPSRYRLFHALVPADRADEVRRRLLAGDDPGLEVATVSVVPLFDADGARLRTDAEEIRRAWRDAGPGDRVVAGIAAAAPGSSEGPALLDARLARVADAVDDVTPDGGAAYGVLPQVPGWLDPADADGVILLVTAAREPATTCLRVFGLPDQGMVDFIRDDWVPNGELGARLGPDGFPFLGDVHFAASGGGVEEDLQAAHDAWPTALPNMPRPDVALAVVPSTADEAARARAREQAAEVLSRVGTGGQVEVAASREEIFGECDGVVLLQPASGQAVRIECVEVRVSSISPDQIGATDDPATLRQLLDRGQRLGEVHFAEGSGTPQSGVAAVVDAWKQQGGGQTVVVEGAVAVVAATGDRALAETRGTAVAQALGFTGSAGSIPLRQGLDLPSNCGAILLIRPQKGQTQTRTMRFAVHSGPPVDPSVLDEDRADPVVVQIDPGGAFPAGVPTPEQMRLLAERVRKIGGVASLVLATRGTGDPRMTARADAVVRLLSDSGLLDSAFAGPSVRPDFDADDAFGLWTTPDGNDVDDLVLLGEDEG